MSATTIKEEIHSIAQQVLGTYISKLPDWAQTAYHAHYHQVVSRLKITATGNTTYCWVSGEDVPVQRTAEEHLAFVIGELQDSAVLAVAKSFCDFVSEVRATARAPAPPKVITLAGPMGAKYTLCLGVN